MRQRILDELKLNRAEELIPAVYRGRLDRVSLAGLAPLVLSAAEAGDKVAQDIVDSRAAELAELAAAVARKLTLDKPLIPIALSGGLLLRSPYYRERFSAVLQAKGTQGDPTILVSDPAEGAIRIAFDRSRMKKP